MRDLLIDPKRFHIVNLPETDIRRLCKFRPFVRQTGDQMRPPWHIEHRRIPDFLIVFIGSGEGVFTINGKTMEICENDILWIPPDMLHSISGTSTVMHCIYVHFDLLFDPARSLWNAHVPGGTRDITNLRPIQHPAIDDPVLSALAGCLHISNRITVKKILEQICYEHSMDRPHSLLLLSGLMLQGIACILKGLEETSPTDWQTRQKMENAAHRIYNNAEKNLTIEDLAWEFGMSASHFRKLFKKTHGKTPRDMHKQATIQKAVELLLYTDMSLNDISEKLCFSSVHSFSKLFKRETGSPPATFRKSTEIKTN